MLGAGNFLSRPPRMVTTISVRIPVKWARVGAKRRWLLSYISYVAHMSQEKGK